METTNPEKNITNVSQEPEVPPSFPEPPLKQGYYNSAGKKVGDFFIGFLGIWVINIVAGAIISIPGALFGSFSTGPAVFGIFGWLISLAIDIALVVLAFKFGRRFIAIGILTTFLIPILILGACFLMFIGSSGMPFGVN